MASCFKVDFDMASYKDIIPNVDDYLKDDELVNFKEYQAGNIDECIWKKQVFPVVPPPEIRVREVKRCLKTGIWICIKEEVIWIPPNYYLALQYGKAGPDDVQFRLKRLKHVYFKIRARRNPRCKGTLTLKNRADGETTMAITDGVWECADGNMTIGQIGIQSKTREDAINPCWATAQTLWQELPFWLKEDIYGDMISGSNIAEKMIFRRERNDLTGQEARFVRIAYYPCVYNAMDGKHNMKKCILDEICKWVEADFYDTFTNYSKFIMPGFERKGLFDMFSSPSDTPTKSNEEVYTLWQNSNPDELNSYGTTKSGIYRYYSNPLEGVQGAYDRFGDADPNEIYDWIMQTRDTVPKDKKMGEIRGFPLNEEEMFGAFEGGTVWDNDEGLKERKVFLVNRRFKDNETKEPVKVFGNLERVDGYMDGDVFFRPADVETFDVQKARFCFSYLPQDREPMEDVFTPPAYVENVLGVDLYARRHVKGKKKSNGAMVNRKFRDAAGTGIVNCPTMIYCNRPDNEKIFYEDILKAAIYNRAMIQYENVTAGFAEYAEDRGYFKWLLATRGQKQGSKLTGDAPSGKGGFMEEAMGLLNAAINVPLSEFDPYPLMEHYWFMELIDDYIAFNPADTHANDLTMSDLQALLGIVKLTKMKKQVDKTVAKKVFAYLLHKNKHKAYKRWA